MTCGRTEKATYRGTSYRSAQKTGEQKKKCWHKNNFSHLWLILSVYNFFTFSLVSWLFNKSPLKKFGIPEKKSLRGGLKFLVWHVCFNKKEMTAVISDLIWSCTNFFNKHGFFSSEFSCEEPKFEMKSLKKSFWILCTTNRNDKIAQRYGRKHSGV